MIEKNFKNLEEQIQIFLHKGMIINDQKYAEKVLLRENYFFINGYRSEEHTSELQSQR